MLNTYLQAFGQNGRETPQKNVSMHVSDNTRVADDGKLLLFGLSSQNFVHGQKGGEGPHELQLCVGIEPIALANAIAVAISIPIQLARVRALCQGRIAEYQNAMSNPVEKLNQGGSTPVLQIKQLLSFFFTIQSYDGFSLNGLCSYRSGASACFSVPATTSSEFFWL